MRNGVISNTSIGTENFGVIAAYEDPRVLRVGLFLFKIRLDVLSLK